MGTRCIGGGCGLTVFVSAVPAMTANDPARSMSKVDEYVGPEDKLADRGACTPDVVSVTPAVKDSTRPWTLALVSATPAWAARTTNGRNHLH